MGLVRKKEEEIRSFGGKLYVAPDGENGKTRSEENKRQRNFETAHIKAYLQGYKSFFFGKDSHGFPVRYSVNEIWTKV